MSKSRSPVKPPLFGFLGEKVLRRVLIGVLLTGLVAALIASTLWLQKVGQEPTGSTTAGGSKVPEVDEFRQKEFGKVELRQLMRCGLQQVDQRASKIWTDIEILETESKAWHTRYEQLLVSEKAKRLGDDPWVVRYFWDQWGKRLPDARVADDARANLNTLLLAIRQALDDPNAAFKPRQQSIDEIGLIEKQVADARRGFYSHRRLMDALARMIEDPKGGDQKTIKAKVEELDAQQALLEHGYPGAKPENSKSVAPAASDGAGARKPGSLDDLYEGVQRTKTGLPDDFGKTTLMRDGVPERQQEATGDGPLYRPPVPSSKSK